MEDPEKRQNKNYNNPNHVMRADKRKRGAAHPLSYGSLGEKTSVTILVWTLVREAPKPVDALWGFRCGR